MLKKLAVFIADIVMAAMLVAGIWVTDYLIPKKGIKAPPMEVHAIDKERVQKTRMTLDTLDWHEKFADHFTPNVVVTDHSYSSPDLSV